jgi:bacteriocin biosynthesis cyclodehydratase domain-containing protein
MQIISLDDGAILKRGSSEIRIIGKGVDAAIDVIYRITTSCDASLADLISAFAPALHPSVENLLTILREQRFLVEATASDQFVACEADLSMFLWDVGIDAGVLAASLAGKRVVVAGINRVGAEVDRVLRTLGLSDCSVISVPALDRDESTQGAQANDIWASRDPLTYATADSELPDLVGSHPLDCLIGASEYGGGHFLRPLNAYAARTGVPFFPVYQKGLVGYAGPLFVPGKTACLECARARQNSHMEDPARDRLSEYSSKCGASFDGAFDVFSRSLGALAAVEIVKGLEHLPGANVGKLIRTCFWAPTVSTHRILRVWNCSICSSLNTLSAVSLAPESASTENA